MRALAVFTALALIATNVAAEAQLTNRPEKKERQVVTYPSPRKDWEIYVQQEDHWWFSIFAKDKSGTVVKISTDPIPRDITVRRQADSLAQITWPCGTGCSAMTFMNSQGKLSRTSYRPLAVDEARMLLAEASVAQPNTVEIRPIFRTLKDPVQTVRLPNAALTARGNPVTHAEFQSNGMLEITYLSDNNGAETEFRVEVQK